MNDYPANNVHKSLFLSMNEVVGVTGTPKGSFYSIEIYELNLSSLTDVSCGITKSFYRVSYYNLTLS